MLKVGMRTIQLSKSGENNANFENNEEEKYQHNEE